MQEISPKISSVQNLSPSSSHEREKTVDERLHPKPCGMGWFCFVGWQEGELEWPDVEDGPPCSVVRER